jgi:threonine aldolase
LRLVAVEQTANLGGGTIWPRDTLGEIADIAHENGLATHMDGARLLNATIATGIDPAVMASGYDSVWLDFTKGLGAPLGAVLCGSADFIDRAWRWKQRMGGSLRQAGMNAAACIYALDHHVARLADDHANAAMFAALIADVPGLSVTPPQTNLVFIDTTGTGRTAGDLAQAMRLEGLLISSMGPYRLRACTHLDVDAAGIAEAAAILRHVVGG